MTNWEKLCTHIVSILRDDENWYRVIHDRFITYLKKIFNWDEGSIKSEVPVTIGATTKYADIVLYGNDFGIVIEMKRPGIALGNEERKQLFLYMRSLGYKYGLLIGSKFQILYDNKGKLLPVASFSFDAHNTDGTTFCEILDKNVCSNKRLFEFVKTKIDNIQKKRLIEHLKANNGENIKKRLKESLIFDGYKEEIVLKVLKAITIKSRTAGISTSPEVQNTPNKISEF
jgi:hypothetical protein